MHPKLYPAEQQVPIYLTTKVQQNLSDKTTEHRGQYLYI